MKKISVLLPMLAVLLIGFGCKSGGGGGAAELKSLGNKTDSLSYTVGLDIAKNFTTQNIEISVEALAQGMKDYNKPVGDRMLDDQQAAQVLQNFQMEMQRKAMADQAAQQQESASKGGENMQKGLDFLAANKGKEGVVALDNGLQYKVLKAGTGKSPTIADKVTIHYTGKLIDGTVFDSSVERGEPATFDLNRLIQGWQIALPLMKEGAKWELYIPSELAYGAQAPPNIGPNQTLIFEIELFAVPAQ